MGRFRLDDGARRFGSVQGAFFEHPRPLDVASATSPGRGCGAEGGAEAPRRRRPTGVPLLGRSPGASLKKAPNQCRTQQFGPESMQNAAIWPRIYAERSNLAQNLCRTQRFGSVLCSSRWAFWPPKGYPLASPLRETRGAKFRTLPRCAPTTFEEWGSRSCRAC